MTTKTAAATIKIVTPCCSRSMRGAPLMRHAVDFVRRTCPKCRTRWVVRLDPLEIARIEGMFVHVLTWTKTETGP